MNNPLITIVTVCYNSEKTIRDTIESVLNQTYTNIEYILVDGASKDNTVDIIKSYEEKAKEKGIIYRWISEPDKGIYDAMNKGIDMASGEWINFMNSGDRFRNNLIIENIFVDREIENVTVIYGDVECDYNEFKKLKKANKIDKIIKGMPFCHQSSFIDVKFKKRNNYNIESKLAADFDLFLKIYKRKLFFMKVDEVISIIEVGGVSDVNRDRVYKENYKILTINGYKYNLKSFYFKNKMTMILKKIIPDRLNNIVIRWKN